MEIQILGEVLIHGHNGPVTLQRDKERLLLAVLAMNAGEAISPQRLYDFFGEDGTELADRTLVHYVGAVRRALAAAGAGDMALPPRGRAGYMLKVDSECIDYKRFLGFLEKARQYASSGECAAAISAYRMALEVWHGPALGGIKGSRAEGLRQLLNDERDNAICELVTQQLRIGESAAAFGSVARLIQNEIPTDRIIRLGLHALAQGGRHADIKAFYNQSAKRMNETAGALPSREVHELARRLRADPTASEAILAFSQVSANSQRTEGLALVNVVSEVNAELIPRDNDLCVAGQDTTHQSSTPIDSHSDAIVPSGGLSTSELKVEFCRRLATSWRELADSLGIPPYECARFAHGYEPREIWEWLEVRGALTTLREALAKIGRSDLVALFDLNCTG